MVASPNKVIWLTVASLVWTMATFPPEQSLVSRIASIATMELTLKLDGNCRKIEWRGREDRNTFYITARCVQRR